VSDPYLDDPALRAAFAAESSEHLDSMERGLLDLERGGPAADLLRALMRSAHTLKASARLFRLEAAADLAHRIEEALVGLQRGAVALDSEQIGTLLRSVDTLRQAMRLPEPPVPTAAHITEPAPAEVTPLPRPPVAYVRVPAARLEALFNVADGWSRFIQDERRHAERLSKLVREIAALRRSLAARLADSTSPTDIALCDHMAQVELAAGVLLRERRGLLRTLAEQSAELHGRISELNLRPLASVTRPLVRALREEARRQGKDVALAIVGDEIELDDHVLQGLAEPLTHLVRNALDHGIETMDERRRWGKPPRGTISMTTRVRADTVTIEVRDDGRGVDLDRIRERAVAHGLLTAAAAAEASDDELLALIFQPGFSTRTTADATSGRGVGMDVVQEKVSRLGGRIAVQTAAGQGTVFRLTVPLAASTTHILRVQVGGVAYAIPTGLTRGVVRVAPRDLPVLILAPAEAARAPSAGTYFVLLGEPEANAALVVDAVLAESSAVLRPFNAALGRPPFVSGVAVHADGTIALVLDPAELLAQGAALVARRRALVAGDARARAWLREVLASRGWAVLGASHGVQALAVAAEGLADLVVVSAELPGLDGPAVARLLRADRRTAHLPIVLFTDSPRTARVAGDVVAVVDRTAAGRAALERLAGTLAAS
jgi:chemotaxis protein histidine kinase CheA